MSLSLGSIAPNFTQESTQGTLNFYDWKKDAWAILFSHPKDFTPVCTTELGEVAKLENAFAKRNVKVLGLSVDSLSDHNGWCKDIEETQGTKLNYPLLADQDQTVAKLYNMIHPDSDPKLTVRSVFVVDGNNKVRLTLTYPPSTGRNFEEILRVVDSLQLTDEYKVATPVNWKAGDDVIIVPSITDKNEIERLFPKGHKEIKPYLRTTPNPS